MDATIYDVRVALRIGAEAIVAPCGWQIVAVAFIITSIAILIQLGTFTIWLVRDGKIKYR